MLGVEKYGGSLREGGGGEGRGVKKCVGEVRGDVERGVGEWGSVLGCGGGERRCGEV